MIPHPPRTAVTTDTRGNAHTIGFATVLGLGLVLGLGVTATLGGMVVYDLSAIQYQSGVGNMNNLAKDSMEVVADAPHRETTMDMVNAELGYGNTVTVEIRAQGGGVHMYGSNTTTVSTRTLTYLVDAGDAPDVFYRLSFGMISRQSEGGNGLLLEGHPKFQATPERALFVLPSITPHPDSPHNIQVVGDSRQGVLLNNQQTYSVKRTALDNNGDLIEIPGNVTIQDADDNEAWAKYFERAKGFRAQDGPDADSKAEFIEDWDGDGDPEVRAFFTTKQIYIQYADVTAAYAERL